MSSEHLSEVAFYYPGPVWHSSEAIKNLLLFFDGIALLVPEYIRDKPERLHPELAGPLLDAGLLHILEPEKYVDAEVTEQLVEGLIDIIARGALDHLSADTDFHFLSMSRLGFYGDESLARLVLDEFKARRLAEETRDGKSIPMHPQVRVLILVLLSQILRRPGKQVGLDLLPATDRADVHHGLNKLRSRWLVPALFGHARPAMSSVDCSPSCPQ